MAMLDAPAGRAREKDRDVVIEGERGMSTTPDAQAHLRHELRTPLNHIIGFSEMLLEDADESGSAALVPSLRHVLKEARELLGFLNAFLSRTAHEPAIDRARMEAELTPSLKRVVASSDALKRTALATAGAPDVSDGVERIWLAAHRLAGLVIADEIVEEAAPAAAAPSTVAGRGTILVVDDNEGNREILSRRLVRDGYTVISAEDGRRALDLLRGQAIDLVLLDVMMPEMDGYEVLKRLKSDEVLRYIPVLMISALDEVDSVIRCIELGAEDYLPKPFNPVLLRARIGACLEKKRLRDQDVRLARELAELNRTLEQRVRDQVAQLERLGRLKRFFSPQLAEMIVNGGAEDPLQIHRREVTVVFLDLRGFTAFAETAEPEEVMGMLREYHAAMGELILHHEGTLERFTGDGMMIFFNDPVRVSNPAERAVRMALAMRDRVVGLSSAWRKRGFELALGIGIAQGYATIGAIGFEGRWDYGAIGTVTNLAARLCSEAKGEQILAPARVVAAVEEIVDAEEIGEFALKGFQRPVQTFNVLALKHGP
jgi:adenylate cyclase